jgi:uncharacterized protein YjbI with pentapeptide repeats
MSNPQHRAELRRGVASWNAWREKNVLVDVDLSGADLSDAYLSGADLGGARLGGANLKNSDLSGANLRDADLRKANLSWANMTSAFASNANAQEADLQGATLCRTDLSDAKLSGARFNKANMTRVNASRAILMGSELGWTDLRGATLSRANLVEALLTRADMTGAELTAADLRSAKMQYARLDGARASGIKLWETQRAGWSIKGIVCDRAFWDEYAQQAVEYGAGEFERLHSDQRCFELFYQGGVSSFELNTLPAMLHHLASLHPEATIRLKSIEETGGGAKISIIASDVDAETTARIRDEVQQAYHAQLALRDNEIGRLQIQKDYLESFVSERLMKALLAAGASQNVFNAPVNGVVISSGNSRVDFQQTLNDNSGALTLLEKMMQRQADLGLSAVEAAQLTGALASASRDLGAATRDKPISSKSLEFVQKLATEAVMKAAGKLGESAVTEWQTWLHQLGSVIHHLK